MKTKDENSPNRNKIDVLLYTKAKRLWTSLPIRQEWQGYEFGLDVGSGRIFGFGYLGMGVFSATSGGATIAHFRVEKEFGCANECMRHAHRLAAISLLDIQERTYGRRCRSVRRPGLRTVVGIGILSAGPRLRRLRTIDSGTARL
jgi:hypothetical protein